MKQTILEIWNANMLDMRKHCVAQSRSRELAGLLDKHHTRLEQLLNDEGKELLEKFEDCYNEMESVECEAAFVSGFVLAARLMIEIYQDT